MRLYLSLATKLLATCLVRCHFPSSVLRLMSYSSSTSIFHAGNPNWSVGLKEEAEQLKLGGGSTGRVQDKKERRSVLDMMKIYFMHL